MTVVLSKKRQDECKKTFATISKIITIIAILLSIFCIGSLFKLFFPIIDMEITPQYYEWHDGSKTIDNYIITVDNMIWGNITIYLILSLFMSSGCIAIIWIFRAWLLGHDWMN